MNLASNPFRILGASTRDDRRRLVALAEDLALAHDPAVLSQARADLGHPRQRLRAELRWFPGLAPSRADLLAAQALAGAHETSVLQAAPPLAAVNALVGGLVAAKQAPSPGVLIQLLDAIAHAAERVNPEDVLGRVNEDRAVAGLPPVDGLVTLEFELHEWRSDVVRALAETLRRLPVDTRHHVLDQAIVIATQSGDQHGPDLLHELSDALAVDFAELLEEHGKVVAAEIEVLRRMAAGGLPEEAVARQCRWLETALKDWDTVAQPLQVSAQARGQEHSVSQSLARELRGLAIQLHNEHEMTGVSERLTVLSREVFAELVRTAERADEDLRQLEQLLEHRREQETSRAEWLRSISFETTIGLVFKERIGVTPEGVRLNERLIPLQEVTRVRWGGTRHSINGIPAGTTYSVCVASRRDIIAFDCRNQQAFEGFLKALWPAVVARLIVELAAALKEGGKCRFGDAVVDDEGITLTKHRLLRAHESRRFTWSEVTIGSYAGAFHITAAADQGFAVSLNYLSQDNVHVLEALMQRLWKVGGDSLSSTLARGDG